MIELTPAAIVTVLGQLDGVENVGKLKVCRQKELFGQSR